MRKPTYVLFVFFLAAESCPLDQYGGEGCKSTTTGTTLGTLIPDDFDDDVKFSCFTCDHSGAEATWTSTAGGGSIELKMHGECVSGAVVGIEWKSTAAPSAGSVSIANVPAPPECVQNGGASVTWFVRVTNKSDQTIANVVSHITCPTSQSSGVAVGPTRVGVK